MGRCSLSNAGDLLQLFLRLNSGSTQQQWVHPLRDVCCPLPWLASCLLAPVLQDVMLVPLTVSSAALLQVWRLPS